MDYFTADLHFWHENICQYCNRPWKSVEEMNASLISLWNNIVTIKDRVYIVGDFCLGPGSNFDNNCSSILNQLNGYKVLIKGNHDRSVSRMKKVGFPEVYNDLSLDTDFGRIYLRHAPGPNHEIGVFPNGYDYFLCGHVHNRFTRQGNIINVGVDVRDYQPITLQELLEGE